MEIIIIGVVLVIALVVGLILMAKQAGKGERSERDHKETKKRVRAAEDARQRPVRTGDDLAERMRRDSGG